jgi:hypothetical protein
MEFKNQWFLGVGVFLTLSVVTFLFILSPSFGHWERYYLEEQSIHTWGDGKGGDCSGGCLTFRVIPLDNLTFQEAKCIYGPLLTKECKNSLLEEKGIWMYFADEKEFRDDLGSWIEVKWVETTYGERIRGVRNQ